MGAEGSGASFVFGVGGGLGLNIYVCVIWHGGEKVHLLLLLVLMCRFPSDPLYLIGWTRGWRTFCWGRFSQLITVEMGMLWCVDKFFVLKGGHRHHSSDGVLLELGGRASNGPGLGWRLKLYQIMCFTVPRKFGHTKVGVCRMKGKGGRRNGRRERRSRAETAWMSIIMMGLFYPSSSPIRVEKRRWTQQVDGDGG